jgi:cytochrome c oxidase assembly factor CtaG
MLNAIQVALAAILLLAYAIHARRLRRAGVQIPRARVACAVAGAGVIVAAVLLLGGPGRRLLYWHTVERLLIGELASLLIAVASIGPVPAAGGRRPALLSRLLHSLAQPQLAVPLWALNFAIWQLPGPYEATMHHDWLQLIDNVLLVGLSVNMWIALLAHLPASHRSGRVGQVAYLLSGRLVGIGLASAAIWSTDVLYPFFLPGDTASSVSPLADQGVAGAITLAEMALTAFALLLWLRTQVARQPAPAVPIALAPERPGFAEQPGAPNPGQV